MNYIQYPGLFYTFGSYEGVTSDKKNQKDYKDMHIYDEYLNDKNLENRERAQLWKTSIGLQAVDNLRVSNFLIEITRKHIEGLISMDEVNKMIDEHYAQKHKQSRND